MLMLDLEGSVLGNNLRDQSRIVQILIFLSSPSSKPITSIMSSIIKVFKVKSNLLLTRESPLPSPENQREAKEKLKMPTLIIPV